MNYKKITLENGLRLIITKIANYDSATITVWVKTGSRNEDEKVNGISHFLEHIVFKGSSRRPSAKAISEAVDAIGGEFNAATSKEWTNFYIKSRNQNLDIAFDVLADMVLNPLIKSNDIQREKGVIIEEIAMYNDTPLFKIGDLYEELAFRGSKLGMDVAGTTKSVKNIQRKDFLRYRKIHYHPENIVVTVSGGVDISKVIELANKYFLSLQKADHDFKPSDTFIKKQLKPRVLLQNKKVEQTHMVLGFFAKPRGSEFRYQERALAAILGGGMSSRLFTEVREKRGLAYSVRTDKEDYTEIGSFSTYAGVDSKRVDEAIKVILDQHYKLASGKLKIDSEELKRAKEYIKGHLALRLEDTKAINALFGENELFLGKIDTPEKIYKAVDNITASEIVAMAKKLFVPTALNLAIIGPYKDKARFEKTIS